MTPPISDLSWQQIVLLLRFTPHFSPLMLRLFGKQLAIERNLQSFHSPRENLSAQPIELL